MRLAAKFAVGALLCLAAWQTQAAEIDYLEDFALAKDRTVPLQRLLFLVDAAQTAGVLPIDVRTMNIDLLAFPGHKGLLGPLGTGGLYIRPGIQCRIGTLIREPIPWAHLLTDVTSEHPVSQPGAQVE